LLVKRFFLVFILALLSFTPLQPSAPTPLPWGRGAKLTYPNPPLSTMREGGNKKISLFEKGVPEGGGINNRLEKIISHNFSKDSLHLVRLQKYFFIQQQNLMLLCVLIIQNVRRILRG
jgi:hypothetical protein